MYNILCTEVHNTRCKYYMCLPMLYYHSLSSSLTGVSHPATHCPHPATCIPRPVAHCPHPAIGECIFFCLPHTLVTVLDYPVNNSIKVLVWYALLPYPKPYLTHILTSFWPWSKPYLTYLYTLHVSNIRRVYHAKSH